MAKEQLDVNLHGRCSARETEIVSAFTRGGAEALIELPGDFVIHLSRGSREWVVSSPGGIYPYFFARSGGRIFHGTSVTEVARAACLEWRWDWQALGDLVCLDQLTGERTLHAGVSRFPPAAVMELENGSGTLKSCRQRDPLRGEPSRGVRPSRALNAFNQAVVSECNGEPLLSISGGLDSRVILSSLLRMGKKPQLLVMGGPRSSDVAISSAIAAVLGLELQRVELEPADYLRHAAAIARLTGGAKTAWNWHTYIYTVKSGLPDDRPFFAGTNGGFAKSQYIDHGMPFSRLNQRFRPLMKKLLALRSKPCFNGKEIGRSICPQLAEHLNWQAAMQRADRLASRPHMGLMDGFQAFFYEERVRNFHGYGLALYGESVSWRAPFLDRDWISDAWGMPREWKMGGAFHRFAISRNFPRLLGFPNTTYLERTTLPSPPRFYRRPWRRRITPRIPYVDYPALFAHSEIAGFILEKSGLISNLIEERAVRQIVDEHIRSRNRTAAMSLLMALCALREETVTRGRD